MPGIAPLDEAPATRCARRILRSGRRQLITERLIQFPACLLFVRLIHAPFKHFVRWGTLRHGRPRVQPSKQRRLGIMVAERMPILASAARTSDDCSLSGLSQCR